MINIRLSFKGAIGKETLKKFNTSTQAKHDIFKAFISILTYIMLDENNQVNGFIYLNDFSGYTMAHFTAWSMQEMKDMMKWQVTLKLIYIHIGSS